MNFKKQKHEVVSDARYIAECTFRTRLHALLPAYNGVVDTNDMVEAITQAVSSAIGEALLSVMDNIYTDEEFEIDLQLRDKS